MAQRASTPPSGHGRRPLARVTSSSRWAGCRPSRGVVSGCHGLCPWGSTGGWLLISLIVLLSSLLLALAGGALALAESRRTISLRLNQTRAFYLAQAGLMKALFDVRSGSGLLLGEQSVDIGPAPGTGDDDVFILGGKAADFLLVNMIPAILDQGSLVAGRRRWDRLRAFRIRNVLSSAIPPKGMRLTLTHMRLTWQEALPGEGVVRIEINNSKVWPLSGTLSSPQPSGTEIDIRDVAIPPNTNPEWTKNTIWFSTSNVMNRKQFIDVAFRMSDHASSQDALDSSIRIARFLPSNRVASSSSFTLKSAGEVRRGAFPFVTWRRIQAEYRLSSADITDRGSLLFYRELDRKTP